MNGSDVHDQALDRLTDWTEPVKILKQPKAAANDEDTEATPDDK